MILGGGRNYPGFVARSGVGAPAGRAQRDANGLQRVRAKTLGGILDREATVKIYLHIPLPSPPLIPPHHARPSLSPSMILILEKGTFLP